ncbi:MAG: hypothetical protein AB2693_23355 [Candidatus Thiodiazotropha sp.]
MIKIARKMLDIWRHEEGLLVKYARLVLTGPPNLRETAGQLLSRPLKPF